MRNQASPSRISSASEGLASSPALKKCMVDLTVARIDAGAAVLLTADHHIVELPTLLLPDDITGGSVITVSANRNEGAEASVANEFQNVQDDILEYFTSHMPKPPRIYLVMASTTSLEIGWHTLELGISEPRRMEVYQDDRLVRIIPGESLSSGNSDSADGSPPSPEAAENRFKLGSLAADKEHEIVLKLRTSSGVLSSNKLSVRTLRG